MDMLSFLRMMGSLAVVLGLLVGALWIVRRYEIRLPQSLLSGLPMRGQARRMALVERLALDTRRSVALIRLDGREHMVLIAPEGVLALDVQSPLPASPTAEGGDAKAEAAPSATTTSPATATSKDIGHA
jgi:flagellar protein FliO/FliZ